MVRKARLLALLVASVCLLANQAGGQPIGGIDYPADGQTVSGIVRVSGFALDFNAVDRIELFVDGVVVNRADTNLPRPDVLEIFPAYVNSATPNPGFLTAFLRAEPIRRLALDRDSRDRDGDAAAGRRRHDQRHRQQRGQPGAVRLHRHPGPVGPPGSQWVVPGRRLGARRRRRRPHRFPRGRTDRRRRGRPRRALHGGVRQPASGRSGGVSGRSELPVFRIPREHRHQRFHQRGPHHLGQATDSEGASRELGHRTVQVINNGAEPPAVRPDRLPARQGLALLQRRPGGFPSPCTPEICLRRSSTSSSAGPSTWARHSTADRSRTSSFCSTARSSPTRGPTASRSTAR